MKTNSHDEPLFHCGFIALAALALGSQPAYPAVVTAWVQRYNDPWNGDDHAVAVAVDGSGKVVVPGASQNSSGGGWLHDARYSRSAYRITGSPDGSHGALGFRAVLAPGQP